MDNVVPEGNSAEAGRAAGKWAIPAKFPRFPGGGEGAVQQGHVQGVASALPCLLSGYISAADEIAAGSGGVFGPSHGRDL